MLGHKAWQTFLDRFETFATVRKVHRSFTRLAGPSEDSRVITGISAEDSADLNRAFLLARPDVVVNCIGIVKQDKSAKDPIASVTVNSLFPHQVAQRCREAGARLIHLSTDCVFSGRDGNYRESDPADAQDLYGRSKLLGEVDVDGCLTIRTSMIGRELSGSHGLLEWFLSQRGGRVRGFKRAIFSGFTTQALSELIAKVIIDHPELTGIWHAASDPISKFDLLTLVKQTYKLAVEIEPDDSFVCHRSLSATRLREATGMPPRSWPEMIEQMHRDPTPYDQIRSNE